MPEMIRRFNDDNEEIEIEAKYEATGVMNQDGESGSSDVYWVFDGDMTDEAIRHHLRMCGVETEGRECTPSGRDCTGRGFSNPIQIHRDARPPVKYILVTQHWMIDI